MNEMNKELAKSIGRVAREARKALQLTQEDAADRIQVSVEFYARIERGTSLPSIGTFARISSALGVSADAMLGSHPALAGVGGTAAGWVPAPPTDSPELRRLMRRLRKARPSVLRLVTMLIKELDENSARLLEEKTGSVITSALPPKQLGVEIREPDIDESTNSEEEPAMTSLVSAALERAEPATGTLPATPQRAYSQEQSVAV